MAANRLLSVSAKGLCARIVKSSQGVMRLDSRQAWLPSTQLLSTKVDARGFRSSARVQMARRKGAAPATTRATNAMDEPTIAYSLGGAPPGASEDMEEIAEVSEDDDDEDGERFQYGRHSIGTLTLPDELREAISYILKGERTRFCIAGSYGRAGNQFHNVVILIGSCITMHGVTSVCQLIRLRDPTFLTRLLFKHIKYQLNQSWLTLMK